MRSSRANAAKSLELAAGASVLRDSRSGDAPPLIVWPAGFVGYRYQPPGGGLLYRPGAGYHFE